MASSRRAAVVGALPGAGNRGDRSVCLDNLKVVLIAAIIAMHAVVGYSTLEVWTYSGLREVTLHPAVEAGLILVVLPFGLVLMALFFLVAGLMAWGGPRFEPVLKRYIEWLGWLMVGLVVIGLVWMELRG